MAVTLDFSNESFRSFCFYSTVCVLKMFAVAIMTGIARRHKVCKYRPRYGMADLGAIGVYLGGRYVNIG